MIRSHAFVPFVLAALSGSCLAANEFSYQIKVGTGLWFTAVNFNASTATTINVGTVGSSDVYLRIYDNTVGTLDDLGRITVTGTSGTGSGRLKVAVWRDFTQDFPVVAATDITARGAASWAGLSFNDPGNSGNTNVALLCRTDLAAGIRDNLTGDIDVGRVFTLQVNGVLNTSTGDVTGGNIDGRLQAWKEDVFIGTLWDGLRDRVRLNANFSHNYTFWNQLVTNNSESIHVGSIIRFNTVGVKDFPEDAEVGQIVGILRGEFNYVPIGHNATSLNCAAGYVGDDTSGSVGTVCCRDGV